METTQQNNDEIEIDLLGAFSCTVEQGVGVFF